MHECYIHFRKDETDLSVYVPWWHSEKLRTEYYFTKEILGGELDYHKLVTGSEIKQIHDSHRSNKYYYAKIEEQVDEILKNVDQYDEIEIVLWYRIGMD